MKKLLPFLTALALLLAACGGSDDSSSDAAAASADDTTSAAVQDDAAPADEAADAAADGGACSAVFDGTITREEDTGSGHTAGSWTGADFAHSKAVDIGDNDYTVYISSAPIEGFTVVADPGEVVVTSFVFGGETALTPGTTIPVTIGSIIDNSGNAQASTTNNTGEVTIVEITGDRLCFDIDYSDDLQTIAGTMSIEL